MSNNLIQFLLLVAFVYLSSCSAVKVEYDANAIIIDGQRKIMNAGSIHYPRSTVEVWHSVEGFPKISRKVCQVSLVDKPSIKFGIVFIGCLCEDNIGFIERSINYSTNNISQTSPKKILDFSQHKLMWPDLIKKAKDWGVDAVETYVFWDVHEPERGKYDFSGNKDFIKFYKLIHEAGLYAIFRIGPYACAEWNNGGFPQWLFNLPGIEIRTDNEIYKKEMEMFTTKIVNMLKDAKLFAPQGGPIIFAQIENEYGDIMKYFGERGKKYVQWCAKMADSQNIGVPWLMCQQPDAPPPMINTCNGFYCDHFKPNNPKSPKMWTENWTAWYKFWGGNHPHRASEDLAFAVARFFQMGGVFNLYYMFHGGTNFGRIAGGPYITTSYDYDAPLDEYGLISQPKYGHLKQLNAALKVGEKALTTGAASTMNHTKDLQLTTFTIDATKERFCFLSNQNGYHDATVDLGQDGKHFVPAWSVSFLENCNKEIYNTAKVTSQTTVKVQKKNYKDEKSSKLSWMWAPESISETLQGKGKFTDRFLLDQKSVTNDATDYLWYMTSVDIKNKDHASWMNATMRVKTSGHGLHAYVNQILIGSQFTKPVFGGFDYSFVFERPVSLNPGANIISFLSLTVGLEDYGYRYERTPTGLGSGSVQLISPDKKTIEVTKNHWSYSVGLIGESQRFYDPKSPNAEVFKADVVPINRPMTWYKTNFEPPLGTEPVVVNLQGMGKGHAWVNGNSLGRYWPANVADPQGCENTCDYRGQYKDSRCRTNCGNPTQIWYFVPRSFLNNDNTNTLVLFEELGGNTENISFQIVKLETICGNAYEGTKLELSCDPGQKIASIVFANFGHSKGSCGSYMVGDVQAPNSKSVVEKACVGKQSCTIEVTAEAFDFKNNAGTKKLAVQAICS